MVETRSGLSVEPQSDEERYSGPMAAKVRDTANTAAARAGRAGQRLQRKAGQAVDEMHAHMTDSQAYTFLALALAVLALPCIFTPKLAARAAFGSAANPPEDQHSHVLHLLACGLMAGASVALGLEEAARKNMLHTFSADTLKLALVAFASGNLLLQFYYPATLTPLAAILVALSQSATLALPASQLFLAREDRERVLRDWSHLPRTLGRALYLRKVTVPGVLYLLLTLAFPVAGAFYFIAPKWTLYHTFGYVYGKSTMLVWKAVGAGLMTVLPAMTYTLKDKAENNLLGKSIPRTLNLGLMGGAVGHLLVFGPILNQGHGGFLLPLLLTTWGMALLASMAGLAAPEAAALVEQAAATEAAAREE